MASTDFFPEVGCDQKGGGALKWCGEKKKI